MATIVTLGALAIVSAPGSLASPGEDDPSADGGIVNDSPKRLDQDNRKGHVAPTARQRQLGASVHARARFNDLGTPRVLTAAGGQALASGLPADPVAAARAYVDRNRELLGLTPRAAKALDVVTVAPMGEGSAVVLRQRFGNLVAGFDGLLVLGVRDGTVAYASGSLARDAAQPAPATLSADDARRIAARDAGVPAGAAEAAELVAVPTPTGARAAYNVLVIDGAAAVPVGLSTFVDARDGSILVREDLVDSEAGDPEWEVFPLSPPVDHSSTDTRSRWCFTPLAGCDEVVGTPASPRPWDVPTSNQKQSSQTTNGNNSFAVHNWFDNNPFSVGQELATPRPNRDFAYPWTNQWFEDQCAPTTFDSAPRNDIDAARANLFAMHNRMHDWSYHLGFTEATWNMQDNNFQRAPKQDDPEQGNAQAGGVSGGPPDFAARDNANQITPRDGRPPITNMYLWQPIAGAFYAPCVDGDFDMTVIAHEYTHAITNRMIAGPNDGLNSPQGMSESWSDLMAMEYLNEHGYAHPGQRAFTIGEYVTSDPAAGIRNYNMSASPLNYSSVDYDFVGLQVHASGEVWSATNFDIRSAMVAKYGAGTPALQKSCANGQTPVASCPGNRRWAQLAFDSFLLMAQSQESMVDARDALLAADQVRFGGADLDILWNAFARRGLGEGAVSNGAGDVNPTPSFASPFATEATASFAPVDEAGQPIAGAQLFVGRYQARALPVADTSAATALGSTVALTPGTYEFVARAPGRGLVRLGPVTVTAGQQLSLGGTLPANLASGAAGATATGDGVNLARLIDDDEATNWASLGAPVAGRGVVVDLAGGEQRVGRVALSAMLRPQITTDADPDPQSRFSALRQFRVLACTATATVDCSEPADFTAVYTSPADAFPSIAPRPRAPELIVRSFDIPDTDASHLRFEVVTNQCTGAPAYAGEQDADPRAGTDCTTNSPQANIVRAAEFEA
ncbi:MAG TPA: M36 family metallopeptidase, partial [Acidimicrobiales bacterium]|nr:M36 family metallopeptidase [Acidimicrobiales bacterium]